MAQQRKKKAEEVTAGREKSTETGREPGYSARSTTTRGLIGGMEGDESPSPVMPGSRPTVSSTREGEEGGSKGTAGPTAQLNRRPRGESEKGESSFR